MHSTVCRFYELQDSLESKVTPWKEGDALERQVTDREQSGDNLREGTKS